MNSQPRFNTAPLPFLGGLLLLCLALPHCVVGSQQGTTCQNAADCGPLTPICRNKLCDVCQQTSDCPKNQTCVGIGSNAQCTLATTTPETNPSETTKGEQPISDGRDTKPQERSNPDAREVTQEANTGDASQEDTPESSKDITDTTDTDGPDLEPQSESLSEPTSESEVCKQGQGRPCYSGPAETVGVGPCKRGVQLCQNGAWGPCVGSVPPSTELCDGKDNDCDGTVDENNPGGGKACSSTAKGECKPGQTQCSNGKYACTSNKKATTELCDGKDNDCDGSIDETFAGKDTSCSTGQKGVCAAGKFTCTAGKKICAQVTKVSGESCDGKDNDCDGSIDENNPGGGKACSSTAKGECKPGQTRCSSGRISCISSKKATTELCDGKDNDCDGVIDDNISSKTCYTINNGICNVGQTTCSGGKSSCASTRVQPCHGVAECSACPGGSSAYTCIPRASRCILR